MGQNFADRLQECTVKVTVPGRSGWGTGFSVAQGVVLTCRHVVERASEQGVEIYWPKYDKTIQANVQLASDEKVDLALLYLSDPPSDHICVYLDEAEISKRESLNLGESVYCYGYLMKHPNAAPALPEFEGFTGDTPPLIKFKDATIQPGISGAALANPRTARVCGVVKETLSPNYPKGGSAIPSSVILQQFNHLKFHQQQYHQKHPDLWIPVTDPNQLSSVIKSIPNNLPRSGVKEFVGREQKLQELHEQLQNSQRIAITAIAGMGGIGKTELALQYAISQLEEKQYPGGFCWLRAREQEIATQIVTFAQTKLGLTLPDGLDEQGQVDYTWGHWREGDVLVVLDDVTEFDAVEPYLPPSDPKFKVLMTTRLNLGSTVQSLSIEELDDESALALLETLVGADRIQSQLEDAKTLCGWVGNLPLGLELLGRFLAKKLDWSFEKLIGRLESKKLAAQALIAKESGMTAQLGVAAALELSWVELSEAEQELACLLGMFAVAPIPWHLVEECLPDQDKDDLEDIRDEGLKDKNLLKRVEERTYQLHQIVKEFFRIKLQGSSGNGESLKQSFCKAMVGVAQSIEYNPTIDVIAGMSASIPHLEELVRQWIDILSDDDLIWPYIGIGRFHAGQGNYGLALPWYQECLEQTKKRSDSEHPSVARSLNNLALLYKNQGRYTEAEPLYLQSLEMRQKLLGSEHPDVALSLNNLALLYDNQGRYTEAEPLYVQALQMYKKLLGSEHPDVALSLNNLALLYDNQGRYTEAEPLYMQALQMYKKLLGSEHPSVASSLNNLAALYKNQGRYTEAEPLYVQALQMRQKLLGSEHPSVASSLNNLAALYKNQGRYTEAEPLYVQALQMRQKLLGSEHPSVARSLNNLALLYDNQGRYTEAEPLYVQALQMRQKLLGSEHPSVAISMWCLGALYQKQGRNEDAEGLYRKALVIFEEKLGNSHPNTKSLRNFLASLS